MKIICEKEKIIKALNSVTKAVASKPNNPILEGILIQTNNNELKLTTYDLEIGIEYIIDCEVEEEGAIVVNATMFSEIIRKLPNTDISISVNDKNLFVQSIIANRTKRDISRDDLINLLIDVQMKGETMDSTSVISPLPEYALE